MSLNIQWSRLNLAVYIYVSFSLWVGMIYNGWFIWLRSYTCLLLSDWLFFRKHMETKTEAFFSFSKLSFNEILVYVLSVWNHVLCLWKMMDQFWIQDISSFVLFCFSCLKAGVDTRSLNSVSVLGKAAFTLQPNSYFLLFCSFIKQAKETLL